MNTAQKIALAVGILGVITGSASQLNDIFAPLGSVAPLIVKEIVSISGFAGGILGFVLAFTTRQGAQVANVAAHIEDPEVKQAMVKAVADLPGVEHIRTNAQADPTLKAMADSDMPDLKKIVPPK